ncbi:hypothetical protein VE00_09317 [Pseudogymnoascus sp. WSF 3629]|nr:hypothetical protein VE00_09317 [Pseudogymnoascus sp. WSF 3629]
MQFFGALGSSSFHFHRFLLNPEVLAKPEVLENLEVPMNPGATLNPWTQQQSFTTRLSVKLLLVALHVDAQKAELQAQKLEAKEAQIARQAANQAQKQLRRTGIKARKEERLRKRAVAQFHKAGLAIPPEFEEPILDPEALERERGRERERERG